MRIYIRPKPKLQENDVNVIIYEMEKPVARFRKPSLSSSLSSDETYERKISIFVYIYRVRYLCNSTADTGIMRKCMWVHEREKTERMKRVRASTKR